MREFKVSEFISLKLEDGKSIIYVDEKPFNQCKYILLNIPVVEISSFDEIDSIDEAAEKLDNSLEDQRQSIYKIPPEVEFWGHCSNLQVWTENDYDTRLLHSNLAFPLLEKLAYLGDSVAKRVIKEEVAKRLINGTLNTTLYLLDEGYLNYLKDDEIGNIIDDSGQRKEKLSFKRGRSTDVVAGISGSLSPREFYFLINHPKFNFLEDYINFLIEDKSDHHFFCLVLKQLRRLKEKKLLKEKFHYYSEEFKKRC